MVAGILSVRNFETLEQLWKVKFGTIMCLGLNPSGSEIVTGSVTDNLFVILDIKDGTKLLEMPKVEGGQPLPLLPAPPSPYTPCCLVSDLALHTPNKHSVAHTNTQDQTPNTR